MEINILFCLGLLFFGLLIGAISPTIGIGGGLLTVPILIMVYGLKGDVATATSLGVIIFTTLSSTLAYIREKRIDFKVALTFIIFAIPGSILGSLTSQWLKQQNLNMDIFQIIFAAVLIMVGIFKIITLFFDNNVKSKKIENKKIDNANKPWWKKKYLYRSFKDKHGIEFEYTAKLFPGIIIAFIGGFLGAMLGVGGGFIYVPILTMALGVPIGIAAATSTFTIFIANFFAVVVRFDSILWWYVLFLSIGTIISSNLVVRLVHKMKSKWILTAFWTMTVLTALKMLIGVISNLI
jgi:hypothetical protein